MSEALPLGVRPETVVTADRVRLRTHVLPGPAEGLAVVLVPGFSCSWDKSFVRRVAGWLAAHADVVAVDLRGHGGSGGVSTLGADEVLDVDAVVARARRDHDRVVTLGFSMGGAAVVRHAGLLGVRTENPVDAVVTVAAASRWWRTETRPMRRLHVLGGTSVGRTVTRRVLRTRIGARAEEELPTEPVAVIGRIAPVPVLVVHGDADPYLLPTNADELFAAAGEPRELWHVPGYGHAELAMGADLANRIGAHLPVLVARGAAVAGGPAGGSMGRP